MASRLELHNKLIEMFGNNNVYYQPPASVKMSYPAIRYSRVIPDIKRADNIMYNKTNCYEIVVIDRMPDNPVIEKLMELLYCTWERHYTSDNLNHDVLRLYY